MKLLIITSIAEFEKDICKLFKSSEIETYSTFDMQGHKLQIPQNIQDNWFSANRDTFNSKTYFTFTNQSQIDKLLFKVEKYNAESSSNNPVRAIVIDIEKYI